MWFNRLKTLSFLYMLFCIWAPVLWFIDRSKEIYQTDVMEYSRLPLSALLVGLIICGASLISQFMLFQMVEKADQLDELNNEVK